MKIDVWKITGGNSNAVLEIFFENDLEITHAWVDNRMVNPAKWPEKFRATVEKAISAELWKIRNG